jgi:hypothetical protein
MAAVRLPRGLYIARDEFFTAPLHILRYDGAITELSGSSSVQAFTMEVLDDDGPGPAVLSLIVGGPSLVRAV